MKTCHAPGCSVRFESRRPFEVWCSPEHGALIARQRVEKARAKAALKERREHKVKLDAVKPKQHWLKKAEEAVNRYVRLRDAHLGCCSCDLPASWDGQWHASHFRSVAAASAVRYNLWNIHKGCSVCNNHRSGNIIEYRPRLIARIGAGKVEWLMAQNQLADYSVEYLRRLQRVFNKKSRRQERRNR